MNAPVKNKSILRAKTALGKKRRALIFALIAVVLLGVALGLTAFFTSRTPFYDPTDGTKYFVAKKDGYYVLKTKKGDVVTDMTAEGNYITAAGTLVYVDEETGEFSTVAAVLRENDGEAFRFDGLSLGYEILLYPYAERTAIDAITVVNQNGKFGFVAAQITDKDTKETTRQFIIEERPDLAVDQSILFANLVTITGRTTTLLRLDTNKVKEKGYAEYGLPANTADATRYFIIEVDDDGDDATPAVSHKVILGDQIPSGDGYFVRYEGRESVYVLSEIGQSDYSRSIEEILFGKLEDYVTAPTASANMTSENYFDVTDFKIFDQGVSEPRVHFSYSGSINKRQDTYYANIPYVTQSGLAGYSVNDHRVDEALYTLYTWAPDSVVKLGTAANMGDNLDDWLRAYKLSSDTYAYRVSFILNVKRTYNSTTGKDVIKKADQEYHEILVSPKQEDGYYYVYNLCMLYDDSTGDFTKPADGYNMVVKISAAQLDFLFITTRDWTSADIFTGSIAYMTELSVKIAPGFVSKYPAGYQETFYLDNSETLQELSKNYKEGTTTLTTNKLVVRDGHATALNTMQFKNYYKSLLATTTSGYASLTDAQKQAFISSGTNGAAFSITIKYELREWNKGTSYYEKTGESFSYTYCFYEDPANARQFFTTITTVKGDKTTTVGDFFTVSTRVKKIMNDTMKLYDTPETNPIKSDALN